MPPVSASCELVCGSIGCGFGWLDTDRILGYAIYRHWHDAGTILYFSGDSRPSFCSRIGRLVAMRYCTENGVLVRNHHNELRRNMSLIGWRSVGRHQSRCLEYGGFNSQERG